MRRRRWGSSHKLVGRGSGNGVDDEGVGGEQEGRSSKGRVHKKNPGKSVVFCQTGGGISEGSKMPNLYFGKVFFQF